MEAQSSHPAGISLEYLSRDRDRVLRLCARLTGDPDVAEDLAQETLLLAWRHAHELHDPAKHRQWLLGIARNVCRQWNRKQGRERMRVSARYDATRLDSAPAQQGSFDLDPDVMFERDELADLLDRAMALLPPPTRDILVKRYIEDLSHAEIGQRLKLSENVVKARLHRGRIALRHVVTTELPQNIGAYGLSHPTIDGWQATRVWCPQCGCQRLLIRFEQPRGALSFRCPVCNPHCEEISVACRLTNLHFARLVGGYTRPKTILRKLYSWAHDYFQHAFKEGRAVCTNCRRSVRLLTVKYKKDPDDDEDLQALHIQCEACGENVSLSFEGLVLAQPAVQSFWQKHARLRTLSNRLIRSAEQVAIVTTFESVGDSARLEVVTARDSLKLLHIHGDCAPRRM